MHFIRLLYHFLWDYLRFRKTYRNYILPMKQRCFNPETPYPESLDYRLKNYASIIAAFFGGQLFRLYQKKSTKENLRLMSACFAASAGFDAYFDEGEDTEILKRILQGKKFRPGSSIEALALETYRQINTISKTRSKKIFETALKLFEAQTLQDDIQAKYRKKGRLTDEELQDLRKSNDAKGGLGALIYRIAIDPKVSQTEESCFLELGALVQLCDDIYDMQRDLRSGQISPVLLLGSFEEMEQLLMTRAEKCFEMMHKLGPNLKRIKAFQYGFLFYTRLTRKKIREISKQCDGNIKAIESLDPKSFDLKFL